MISIRISCQTELRNGFKGITYNARGYDGDRRLYILCVKNNFSDLAWYERIFCGKEKSFVLSIQFHNRRWGVRGIVAKKNNRSA